MSRKTLCIVDYNVGNQASVLRAFQKLDYRCRISHNRDQIADADLIVLPGVGAFPTAMSGLHAGGLVEFLKGRVRNGQPIVGLCLGMQLLANESLEHGLTAGLGLIPGKVVPLHPVQWHIGWNTIKVVNNDQLLMPSDGESFYFNHSYMFDAPEEYQVCISRLDSPFAVGVRHDNVVGLQFHPEKSQGVGRTMLKNLVEGLTRA